VKQTNEQQAGQAAKGDASAPTPPNAGSRQAASTAVNKPDPFPGRAWPFCLLLVAVTLLAYLPGLTGKFVWDDDAWTSNLSRLTGNWSGLLTMWSNPRALQQYYPLTGTTFWIDHQLWGDWTLPYHVENVLLHACAAVLLWRLLWRLAVPGAWLAAAVFALHPVMVESAGWITERKNVLSLVLYLGALLAYARFAQCWQAAEGSTDTQCGPSPCPLPVKRGEGGRRPGEGEARACSAKWHYGVALLLFLCAYLSKATAFSLPAVLLLLAWWKRGHIRWREDVLPSLPFFAVAIGLGLVTANIETKRLCTNPLDWGFSLPERCLIAGRAFWFYIGKLFWPANLCFLYPRWQLDARSLIQCLYPISAAAALLGLWLARGRIGRGPATALFFYAGTLFPVMGFINAYGMRYSFVWDHWTYLSSLGLIALAAALMASAADRLRLPALLPVAAAILLPVLAVLTWQQSGMYADLDTLWRTTLARNPRAFLAHNNVGLALLEQGQMDEAVAHFRKALEAHPGFAEAHSNLGNALFRQARLDDAIIEFQRAVQLDPRLAGARNNLGLALLEKGRADDALAQFFKALEVRPDIADIYNNMGTALRQLGRLTDAVYCCEKSLELQPGSALAWCNLGVTLALQGNAAAAINAFERSLALQPENLQLLNNLAWALATSPESSVRNGARAVDAAQKAERLSGGKDPWVLGTLAAAYAEAGRFPEAIAAAQRALELAMVQTNSAHAEALRTHIRLYEAGSPVRDSGATTAKAGRREEK
jgi:protein O-mannosyl-transferase